MKVLLLLLLLLLIQLSNIITAEVDLTTYYKQFVKENGYTLEEHEVTTEDGYILSVWHILPKSLAKRVAYFQHGLSDTAWCFFQLGSKSLPFLLLREGYEVWLGNGRGNVFSNKHVSKNPNDSNSGFYEFSIDDNVKYDLPAIFKYIYSKTQGKKMSYIAHSQGSTIFCMLYMHNPTLVEYYIDHFSSIGTVPNIAHAVFGPIKLLDTIYGLFDILKFKKGMLVLNNSQRLHFSNFCKTMPFVCKKFFDSGASIKPTGRFDYSRLYNFLYYYPGGTNKNTLLQWSQIHTSKQLVYFNPNYNKEKTATPYNINNLKNWKIKALLARTDMDTFSSYEDVTELYNIIEDKSLMKLLDISNYGHLDVLSADSAYEDIFLSIVKFLRE